MLYPSTNDLMEKIDSRYTLVLAAAKRARQIIDGDEITVRAKSQKPVSIATQEIHEGKVTYSRLIGEKELIDTKREQRELKELKEYNDLKEQYEENQEG
ncbi:DNA-directed RNA polymerase subunit omega [Alkaliphilus transvaalensis]|uniref:DNA-directed RNA polymerase subunit omega n=1 Tax=Alkaliphilus transvaalensis TaxID=114628 RepID=UPI00047CA5BB|nr:DNA-directed RNA polymerase subunit omega [Alkaliphilus transvaalensis]